MSSVILNGDSSGAITLSAPAVAGTNTITLPASTGTVALTTSGTPVSDIWYLNTGYSNTVDVQTFITSNLSQLNQTGTGVLGSMSQSSGVFTFPQTGVYRVAFCAQWYSNSNTARYCSNQINVSTDGGSTYSVIALGYSGLTAIVASSNTFLQIPCETQINVNNTSNIKVKFATNASNTINVGGGSAQINTYMIFTRLGNSV